MLGALALGLCVGSYLMRNHRALTLCAAAGVLAWSAYFAVQGFGTATVMCLLMAGRVASGVWVVHWAAPRRWALTLVVWALSLAGAWATWQGWLSVPSTLASLLLAWAGYHLHYQPLRRALLAGELLLFVNGWLTHSGWAMASAALGLAMNVHVILQERKRTPQA